MHNSKTVTCYNCNSTILSLPQIEVEKLAGLNFRCECCGHENYLGKSHCFKGTSGNDPYLNTFSIENLL